MFTLFEDQKKFISDIRDGVKQHHRVIAYAPTGYGKSKVFVTISQMSQARGTTTLILTESKKIFSQIAAELQAVTINAASPLNVLVQPGAIHVAMAQTLAKRAPALHTLQRIAAAGRLLTVVDECHIGTPTKIIKNLAGSPLIGFTASPDWRSARHLPDLYKGMVMAPQVDELIQNKRLCSYLHWERRIADLSGLQRNGQDFSEGSQQRTFDRPVVYAGLFDDLRKINYTKALIYTSGVESCEKLYAEMTAAGFKCVRVHTDRSILSEKQEAQALVTFEDVGSGMNVCISVGTLTKGYDFKFLDLIVLHRATLSLALYLQMIGRGSRIILGIKEQFKVLDYGGNLTRFGPWDMDRDWEKLWLPQKGRPSPAPMKFCPVPACSYMMPAAKPVCPNCGYVYEYEPAGLVEGSTLVLANQDYQAIRGKFVSELQPAELAIYAKAKNKRPFCALVARQLDAVDPGYLRAYAFAMGYKESWIYTQKEIHSNINFDFILR